MDSRLDSETNDLAQAPRLVSKGWEMELRDGLVRDPAYFRVVSPFIKQTAISRLLQHRAPEELKVVTRFSLADFGAGVSDLGALREVIESGGRVRGIRGLHSKLYLFGSRRAIVTSANLTSSGLGSNREFGCVSEEPVFVSACHDYFKKLWHTGKQDLTLEKLQGWEIALDEFLSEGGRQEIQAVLPDYGEVESEQEVETVPETPREAGWWPEGSSQSFVKFFGQGNNRVSRSFPVFEEVERSGCHWACTYPAGKRPVGVQEGDTLFMGRMVSDPADILVFGRAIGRSHRLEADDASPEEIQMRPWKAKWPHYIRVHHAEFIAGDIGNGVSLRALMDELGSDAFASTQHNQRSQNGRNTNPRLAYRRQPAVRLTRQGADWMRERVERQLYRMGRIPNSDLGLLDWPERDS